MFERTSLVILISSHEAAPPHEYKQHSDEHTLGATTSSTSGALPGLAPMSIMDVASRRGNEAGMSELRGHAGALHRRELDLSAGECRPASQYIRRGQLTRHRLVSSAFWT